MAGMGVGHILYVPLVLIIGLVIGWALGKRAAEQEAARHNARVRGRRGGTQLPQQDASNSEE